MISRRTFALTLPAAAVAAGRLRAAGVDGKWTAEIESPRGATTVMFDLKSDGETLTGTVGNDMGSLEIEDGKVAGDSVTFFQTMTRGDFRIRIKYDGKVQGDTMELTRSIERPGGGGQRTGGRQGAGGGRGQGGPGGGRPPGPGGARGQAGPGGGRPGAGGPGGGRGRGGMGRSVTFTATRVP